ncbi:MAG: glycosyltransferase family 4 protein, partial [Alphaproteobacteria bacterium]|nr:glycosyltransferase family 4 protein [Alphaproteobacteria bacterium]
RLSEALARRGHSVTVIHDADAYISLAGQAPAPVAPPVGVEVVSLKSSLGVASSLATHQIGRPIAHHETLKRLLKGVDVTWFHNISLVGGPGLLSYGSGLKVYEAHEHWLVCPTHVLWRFDRERCDAKRCLSCTLSYKRPPQLWRATGLLERQARKVDVFIAKSEFSRAKHREFGFAPEMKVVPYFLPDEAETAVAGAPAHDRPYFLFVGRLEKIKGVQDVIPAFAGEAGPDLLVIGDGDYAGELKRQAEGMSRVRFLGRKPPSALGEYYRDAVALVTPSLCFETFGIVLIEAFRRGLPVIARRLGPFPEIIDKSEGGLLFDTPVDLRTAMESLSLDPDLRARMGAAARRAYQRHWSETAVMGRYYEVLKDAAVARGDHRLAQAFDL